MPLPTEFRITKFKNSVPNLGRLIKSSLVLRRKVFFDSPGLLEQSQHWVVWSFGRLLLELRHHCFGRFLDVSTKQYWHRTLQPLSGKMIVSSPAGGIVQSCMSATARW